MRASVSSATLLGRQPCFAGVDHLLQFSRASLFKALPHFLGFLELGSFSPALNWHALYPTAGCSLALFTDRGFLHLIPSTLPQNPHATSERQVLLPPLPPGLSSGSVASLPDHFPPFCGSPVFQHFAFTINFCRFCLGMPFPITP